MKIKIMRPTSFRGRRINWSQDVWVYRNLMRTDGPWYSIMQNQVIVGHSRFVLLHGVRFVVREGGRARVIESGVKNVHAFAVGRPSRTELHFDDEQLVQLGHRAGYLPKLGGFWVDYKTGWVDPFDSPEVARFLMTGAGGALLSEDGLTVDEPTIKGDPIDRYALPANQLQ